MEASPVTPEEQIVQSAEVQDILRGFLLALGGGYLDGFTYLNHGKVFANAMTGNVVLLGINSMNSFSEQGLRHLPPILMFMLGIAAARILMIPRVRAVVRQPYLIVVAIEIAVLGILSVQPLSRPDILFTMPIAFVASMQVETFNRIRGNSFNSTFTTGNLRTLSEGLTDLFFWKEKKDAGLRVFDFSIICGSFAAGAVLAGVLAPRMGNHALWIELLLLIAVGAIVMRMPTKNSVL